LPFVLYKKLSLPKDKKTLALLSISAILNTTIPFSLINHGQEFITSGMSALMLGFGPFITLLLGQYLTSDEKISKYKIISILFGFAGLVLLLGDNIIASNIDELKGQGFVLMASLSYALSSLVIRKTTGVSYLNLSFLMFGVSAVILIPILFFVYDNISFSLNNSTIAIIYLGILPTAIASIYRVKMVQEVGIQFMSQVAYLIPIFAMIWAWLVLDEIPKTITLVALVVVLTGLYIRSRSN
jgi:drug/metabolite transporter (DMT)-like permease